jgi:hypothetical protein
MEVLVRVYGPGSEKIIDRQHETCVSSLFYLFVGFDHFFH